MTEKCKVQLLSENSSESEDDLHINKDYAKKYDKWRQSEELQKLKAKYGDDSSSSSSSSESEDDDLVIEKDFLKTLSLLKKKDPKIYDENANFFTNAAPVQEKPKKKKAKPLYLKDLERKCILEKNGELSSEDETPKKFQSFYDAEQQEIKESFKTALVDSNSDEDENDFLQVRKKNNIENEKEESDYIQWLKGEKDNLPKEDSDEDLKYLHDLWNSPNIDNDEKFLKDYILNRKFVTEDKSEDDIPTYEEITNDIHTLSDDEKLLDKQEVFEHKYNFRFEEPDSEFIKQYPRTIGDSLRRTDNKRKLKRIDYQERKRKEKEQKREELKRLKALKRAQIEEMFNKLKETTGNDQLGLDYSDIDGDFDPNEHDKKMKELFNDDYYNINETERPVFPSDEELDNENNNWDNWEGENTYEDNELHCEDPGFNMDADYNPKLEFQKEMIQSHSKKSKKRKKKSKFAEMLSKPKPVFEPSEKTLEQFIEDYYKLDCEDVIGGQVFRFKYRNVIPNNFGLSADEILKARDKELNKWCSLKKTCQHRSEQEEKFDIAAFSKKAQNIDKKRKTLPSLFEELESAPSENVIEVKKIGKQKRKFSEDETYDSGSKSANLPASSENLPNDMVTKNDMYVKPVTEIEKLSESDLSRKKRKRKKKHNTTISENQTHNFHAENSVVMSQESASVSNHTSMDTQNSVNNTKRKRKKKKKYETGNDQNLSSKSSRQNFNNDRKNLKQSENVDKRLQLSDARLKAYGINPKKFKNRIKYSSNQK